MRAQQGGGASNRPTDVHDYGGAGLVANYLDLAEPDTRYWTGGAVGGGRRPKVTTGAGWERRRKASSAREFPAPCSSLLASRHGAAGYLDDVARSSTQASNTREHLALGHGVHHVPDQESWEGPASGIN
ncbi:hypothetical protein GQ53DRAFT_423232 [Thozetella sp. PMI_491]|nr:hypothetical protein GQ53DRAFT_423232 [Thozetella sp. PMI_491]